MNRVAESVRTAVTSIPASESRRARSADLYAAMPPVTPSNTRRPCASGTSVDLDDLLGALVIDLALGDLLEGDRERLVAEAGLDERRHELASPLTELVVVRVDFACALGRQDHQGVLGVDGGEQIIDLRFDHRYDAPVRVLSAGQTVRDASMIAATSSAARSASSFTTTAWNHDASPTSRAASRKRSPIIA